MLGQYGILVELVQKAYQHLLTLDEHWTLRLHRYGCFEEQQETFDSMLSMARLEKGVSRTLSKRLSGVPQASGTSESARILIAGSGWDAEMRCTSEILAIMCQNEVSIPACAVHSTEDVRRHIHTANTLVPVLSKGLLQDSRFAAVLVMIDKLRATDPLEIVTVLADSNFSFPDPDFYSDIEQDEAGMDFVAAVKKMLDILARPFSPQGSWGIMTQQVVEICKRFRLCKEPQKKNTVLDEATASTVGGELLVKKLSTKKSDVEANQAAKPEPAGKSAWETTEV